MSDGFSGKGPQPPGQESAAQKFLRDRIHELEKRIHEAQQRHIVPLQNELEPLQRALVAITAKTYDGLGTLAAARKLLIDRAEPMTQEEIATKLVKAGFQPQQRPGRGDPEDLLDTPLAAEQRVARSIARFVYEGELGRDAEGRVILPEWKKKGT